MYRKAIFLIKLVGFMCVSATGDEIAFGGSTLRPDSLRVVYRHDKQMQVLGEFSVAELKKKKMTQFEEKLPGSVQAKQFRGANLSALIEEWAKLLSPDKRANIDLVILKTADQKVALIPRSFFVKYPSYLVYARKGEDDLEENAKPFQTVIPWSSRPRMKEEHLPLESYFVTQVTSVELTSYREGYAWAFLNKKSEPALLKGERLFVQNCLSCHSQAQQLQPVFNINKLSALEGKSHPSVSQFKLDSSQVRSIQLYGRAQLKQQEGNIAP